MKRTVSLLAFLLVSLPVMAGPDLVIVEAAVNPAAVKPLETDFTFVFKVKNIGNVGVSGAVVKVPVPTGAVYVSTSVDSSFVCALESGTYVKCTAQAAGILAPNGGISTPITVKMRARAANSGYSVAIEADPFSQITENSESNNKATLNGSFSDLPRVAVVANNCPASKLINQHYVHTFILKNLGTLDVRYPGFKVNVSGNGLPVKVTKIEGGSAIGLTLNTLASEHNFTWVPGPESTPLAAGRSVQGMIYLNSPRQHLVTSTATIDTQAIQDVSPKDNSATCSTKVFAQ